MDNNEDQDISYQWLLAISMDNINWLFVSFHVRGWAYHWSIKFPFRIDKVRLDDEEGESK